MRETGMRAMWRLAATPIFGFLMWNPVVKINHRLWAVPQSRKIAPKIRDNPKLRPDCIISILGFGFLFGWDACSNGTIIMEYVEGRGFQPKRTWQFGKILMDSK